MATAPIANVDTLGNLSSLLQLFKGTGTTSSSSSTSSNITPEGMQAIIQQILGGSAGLSAVASGQKSAGLYSGSTNQLLINDLVTRTAGELAKQQAGTTTSQVSKTGPRFNPTPLIAGLAAQKLLGPSIKTLGDKTGINDLGQTISDTIFGPSAGTGSVSTFGDASGSLLTSGTADIADGTATSVGLNIGADTGAGILGAGATDAATDSALSGVASAGTDVAGFTALDAGAAAGGVDLGIAAGAGDAAIGAGVAGGADAAIGAGAAAGIGDAAVVGGADAAAGGGLLEGLGEAAAVAWVICTELRNQGRLPNKYYIPGLRVFMGYPRHLLDGYYIWANPTVEHLRTHPYSLYSRLICWMFNHRAAHLAGVQSVPGYLITHGTYASCWTLGWVIIGVRKLKTQLLGELNGQS